MRHRKRRWKLHLRNDHALGELARWTRPILLGWVRYYACFYPSALHRALRTLDRFLVRWARRKYKLFRGHAMRAWDWLNRLRARQPTLFAHWSLASTVGR
jgi:RNA-directed DNA polymerase